MSNKVLQRSESLPTIKAPAGAGITIFGASRGFGSLSRGIADVVAIFTVAPALEGVVQSDPMSDLMGQETSFVVIILRTTGEGCEAEHDSIFLGPFVSFVAPGEGRVTEIFLQVKGVDIEGTNISPSKLLLHFGLLFRIRLHIVEPVRVQRPSGIVQLESETSLSEIVIQDIDLVLKLVISEIDCQYKEIQNERNSEMTDGT